MSINFIVWGSNREKNWITTRDVFVDAPNQNPQTRKVINMAITKYCDKCGKVDKKDRSAPFAEVTFRRKAILSDKEYDLCASCAFKIETLIENGDKK